MHFPDALMDHNFRVSPLRQECDETVKLFQQSVQDIDVSVIDRYITLRMLQTTELDPLTIVWSMQREPVSFQIDLFRQMGESALSFVALDCRLQQHTFGLSYTTGGDRMVHRLEMVARQLIRIGPNGALSLARDDKHSNEDLMLTKLIMLHPKE